MCPRTKQIIGDWSAAESFKMLNGAIILIQTMSAHSAETALTTHRARMNEAKTNSGYGADSPKWISS